MKKVLRLVAVILLVVGLAGTAYFYFHQQKVGGCLRCPPNALCADLCSIVQYQTSKWIYLTGAIGLVGLASLVTQFIVEKSK
ncbi:MAG TPA: hypothetical protein VGS28_02945 [Candidatus Saccharimonadales bacterium]|nr:hypothetical protein [Candidatus Saccharimonadales bacterium]